MILLASLGGLMAIADVALYFLELKAGIAVSVFLVFYFLAILSFWLYLRTFLIEEMVSFATEYGQIQKQILKDLKLPHALTDAEGKIIWTNSSFENVLNIGPEFHKSVTSLFSEITPDKFPTSESENGEEEYSIRFEERYFKILIRRINISGMVEQINSVVDFYTGEQLLELFSQIAATGGEGVSRGTELVITSDGKLVSARLHGQEINPQQKYRVTTINYLLEGNDKMMAFRKGTDIVAPDAASNNTRFLIMNYFKEKQARGETVDSQVEGRIKKQ